jgi:hypothetical protein
MITREKVQLRTAVIAAVLYAAGCFCPAVAVEEAVQTKSVNFTGYASFAFGQVVKGLWENSERKGYNHYWSHHVYAGVGFNARMSDNFEIVTRLEGKMWNAYPNQDTRQWNTRNYSMWLDQANFTYGFGGLENPWLSVTGGYFVYKYNPEVRDLGEFLFRSMTYPGYLINYFDFPAARLLGFKVSLNLLQGNLKQDLFIHEECEYYPFGNISIGYIANYNIMKVVEIGAGFDLCRLFDINTELTTPTRAENLMFSDTIMDSFGFVYRDVPPDSPHYTFKANKVMGRMTIDPKPLLGSFGDIFGPSDLKLFGEIAVIGLKNYPFYYDDITKRMPMMFGMNVPTFKILDHFSVEFEYYAFPFTTYMMRTIDQGFPLPGEDYMNWWPGTNRYKDDDWKWAVHLKKTILPGLSITVQVARDHYRGYWSDGLPAYMETLIRPDHLAWNAKITGSL